jgi:hypothetical protein
MSNAHVDSGRGSECHRAHHMLQALTGLFSVGSSGFTRTAKAKAATMGSQPVNVRTSHFRVHDLPQSGSSFPQSLTGSTFLEYDGANRALKVSRASIVLLQRRGLPWQLASLTNYALGSRWLSDAVIGQTTEVNLGAARGAPRGFNQLSRQHRRPAAGSTGTRARPHQATPIHAVAHLAPARTRTSPETLGATQGGYRSEEARCVPTQEYQDVLLSRSLFEIV